MTVPQAVISDTLPEPNGQVAETAIPAPMPKGITAAELQCKTLPPLRYAVPGILPQGAALLCGPPKIGKSRLALQLALSVAMGGVVLSHIEVAQSGVLYLSLEDGERRLQERIAALIGETAEPWPNTLNIFTEWPRLGEGCEELLDAYLTAHPETKFVIVDVLQMVKGDARKGETTYAADYRAMRALKAVADRHDAMLLALHHTRKLDANDPVSLVSGTNGLSGAVDTILIFQREPNGGDATLYLRGRDVEEAQFTLDYARDSGAWAIRGETGRVPLSDTRQKIINVLMQAAPRTLTPKEVEADTGLSADVVRKRLGDLEQAGLIHRPKRGHYSIVPDSPRHNRHNQENPHNDAYFQVTDRDALIQPPRHNRHNAGDGNGGCDGHCDEHGAEYSHDDANVTVVTVVMPLDDAIITTKAESAGDSAPLVSVTSMTEPPRATEVEATEPPADWDGVLPANCRHEKQCRVLGPCNHCAVWGNENERMAS